MEELFECIILGGGPAGMAAAIYCARGALKTAIIDISMLGGAPTNYLEIENYPGFAHIGGYDLSEKFEEHVDKFNVQKFPMQEIVSVDLESNPKIIKTLEHEFRAKTVIIATGASFTKLGCKGELENIGKGVSYCAVCDGAFFKDKIVTVVGGGNTAIEEGLYLTRFAKKVYIVHRRDELRADKILQKHAFDNEKIAFVFDSVVEEIKAEEGRVKSVIIRNTKLDAIRELETDGVFPFIGFTPNAELFDKKLKQNEQGFIYTDKYRETTIKGVFAAGDVRDTPLRQVVTAVADGAIAASSAVKYVDATIDMFP